MSTHPVLFIAVLVLLLLYVPLYKLYKTIMRPCEGCGNIHRIKRIQKMRLPYVGPASFWKDDAKPKIRWSNFWRPHLWWPNFRWSVYPARTETYSRCPKCRQTMFIKFSLRRVTVWHLKWVERHDRQQFIWDGTLTMPFDQGLRDMLQNKDIEYRSAANLTFSGVVEQILDGPEDTLPKD